MEDGTKQWFALVIGVSVIVVAIIIAVAIQNENAHDLDKAAIEAGLEECPKPNSNYTYWCNR